MRSIQVNLSVFYPNFKTLLSKRVSLSFNRPHEFGIDIPQFMCQFGGGGGLQLLGFFGGSCRGGSAI